MKITKQYLKQVIKEAIEEGMPPPPPAPTGETPDKVYARVFNEKRKEGLDMAAAAKAARQAKEEFMRKASPPPPPPPKPGTSAPKAPSFPKPPPPPPPQPAELEKIGTAAYQKAINAGKSTIEAAKERIAAVKAAREKGIGQKAPSFPKPPPPPPPRKVTAESIRRIIREEMQKMGLLD